MTSNVDACPCRSSVIIYRLFGSPKMIFDLWFDQVVNMDGIVFIPFVLDTNVVSKRQRRVVEITDVVVLRHSSRSLGLSLAGNDVIRTNRPMGALEDVPSLRCGAMLRNAVRVREGWGDREIRISYHV